MAADAEAITNAQHPEKHYGPPNLPRRVSGPLGQRALWRRTESRFRTPQGRNQEPNEGDEMAALLLVVSPIVGYAGAKRTTTSALRSLACVAVRLCAAGQLRIKSP